MKHTPPGTPTDIEILSRLTANMSLIFAHNAAPNASVASVVNITILRISLAPLDVLVDFP